VIGDSAEESGSSQSVPTFALEMIDRGQSLDSNAKRSVVNIFGTLKDNDFRIVEGVDSKEVSNFVRWIEFSQTLME
jgi:hypothetical protein